MLTCRVSKLYWGLRIDMIAVDFTYHVDQFRGSDYRIYYTVCRMGYYVFSIT